MLPTNVSQITLNHPALGKSPAGFDRIHVEMFPREVGKLIGYDPRTLIMKPRRSKVARGTRDLTPHNVSGAIVELQNKVQRSIDNGRVQVMVDYLRMAMETGTFADWGAIELVTAAQPDVSDLEEKHVVRFDSDADYFIADGQHRYCAILDFCRAYPAYADRFTQALTFSILPEERLAEWAGQAFHDRNYYAVSVRAGKALAVDSRNPINSLAKQMAGHPTIKKAGGIAYERDTLLKGDERFTTHAVLHRFVRGFLYGRPGLDRSNEQDEQPAEEDIFKLHEWLTILGEVMPWYGEPETRDTYLARSSAVLSALAVVGHDLFAAGLDGMELSNRIRILRELDWRKTNVRQWEGILGSVKDGNIQPASSRPAIDATIRHIRGLMGLVPTAEVTS